MKTDDLIALLSSDNAMAQAADARAKRLANSLILAAILAVCGLFVAFLGVRAGAFETSTFGAILRKEVVTISAALVGVAGVVALSRPTGRLKGWWVLPVLVLAALVLWEVASVGVAGSMGRLMGRNALACLAMIPLLAVLPLMALFYALARSAPASPSAAGAWAGLAAAGVGATLYALHCTDDSMLFVAAWYGLATLMLMAGGALAGARWLKW